MVLLPCQTGITKIHHVYVHCTEIRTENHFRVARRTCFHVSDVDNLDVAGVTHLFVGGVGQHVARVGKVAGSHGSLCSYPFQFFAGAHVPHANRIVGGTRREVLRLPVDIQAPDSATVAVEGAQLLTIDGVPVKEKETLTKRIFFFLQLTTAHQTLGC